MRSRRALEWYRVGLSGAVALLLGGDPHALVAQSRPPRTAFLIVAGVGGEKRLSDQFLGWSRGVASAATTRFGVPDSLVVVLAEDATQPRVTARSSRENIMAQISRLSGTSRAGDRLVVILFGHGSTQGDVSRFNVPGPDMTPDDFRLALAPMRDASLVFVNTTSASGDFVKALAGPNRTIITATRSGREQNETLFPEYFVAALTTDVADGDKDGRANLLEAFTYARREVERVFEQGNRIATEHPMLEDDGDGVGHSDASEKGPDGLRARAVFLEPLGGSTVAADPRAAKLLAERRDVESRIEAVRAKRASMSEEEYQRAIEPLMVQLAETTRALRALDGKKP
ncbi:MAG: hypothetical protein ABI910_17485 [Gemmatimonadota bacterium]